MPFTGAIRDILGMSSWKRRNGDTPVGYLGCWTMDRHASIEDMLEMVFTMQTVPSCQTYIMKTS
jgi:hypothetical protein